MVTLVLFKVTLYRSGGWGGSIGYYLIPHTVYLSSTLASLYIYPVVFEGTGRGLGYAVLCCCYLDTKKREIRTR